MSDQTKRSSATGTIVRDTEIPDLFSQDDFNDFDLSTGAKMQQYMKGWEGDHPSHVINELRTNPDAMDQVANGIYDDILSNTESEETLLEQKGFESREDAFKKIKANVRDEITNVAYSGEEVSTTIGKGLRDLRGSQNLIPVNGADRVIKDNPDIFGDLLDENGELNVSNQALTDTLYTDEELYNNVVNQKINAFNDQLQSKHNSGVLDPTVANVDPKEYGKAFLMYEKYGKEGLSKYINYFQYADPDKPFDEQSATAQNSIEFLTNEGADGEKPLDYVNDSVSGLEFEKVKPKKPKRYNYNQFTKIFGVGDATKDTERDVDNDPNVHDDDINALVDLHNIAFGGDDTILDTSEGDDRPLWRRFLNPLPDQAMEDVNTSIKQARIGELSTEEFYDLFVSGGENAYQDSDEYHTMLKVNSKKLADGDKDLSFNVGDIFATIQAYARKNGGYLERDEGNPEYAIDYEKAPMNVRVAMDLLTYRSDFDMFVKEEGGMMILQPNRPQNVQEDATRAFLNTPLLTSNKLVERVYDNNDEVIAERVVDRNVDIDDDTPIKVREGNIEQEYVLDNSRLGIGSWIQNNGALALYTGTQMLNEFGLTGVDYYRQVADLFGAYDDEVKTADTLEEKSAVADRLYNSMRDYNEASPVGMAQGTIQKGLTIGSSFLWYMTAMRGMGRGGNKMISKGINKRLANRLQSGGLDKASKGRSLHNLSVARKLIKPPKNPAGKALYTKSDARLRLLSRQLSGKGKMDTSYIDFVTGGVLYNVAHSGHDKARDDYSIMGSGVVDMANDYLFDWDTDVEGWYKEIGGQSWYAPVLRTATNIIGDEVLGHTLDTMFGMARFGKAGMMKAVGKKYSGIEFDSDTGGYRKISELFGTEDGKPNVQGFSPDYRRFFHNINNDLARQPRLEYKERVDLSALNVAKTGEDLNEATKYFDDFARAFTGRVKPVVKDVRDQIRETLTQIEGTFGGNMSKKDINTITEGMYKDFWVNVGNGMQEVFPNREVLDNFVTALRSNYSVDVEKIPTESGKVRMTKAEANHIASNEPNTKIQSVGDEFEVLRIRSDEWVVDMVDGIRTSVDINTRRKAEDVFITSERSGKLKDNGEAIDTFNEWYGTEVMHNGKRMIVKGLDGDDLIMTDVSGREVKAPLTKMEDSNQSIRPEMKTRNISETKERLTEGKVLFTRTVEEFGKPDMKSPQSISKTMKKVDEKIERLHGRVNEGEDEGTINRLTDRIEELNKVNDYLNSRKEIATRGKDGVDFRKLSDDDLQAEKAKAIDWIDNEVGDVQYNNRGSIATALSELKERLAQRGADLQFGSKTEQEKAGAEMDQLNRAINYLEDRYSQMAKGAEEFENLSDRVRQWIDGDGRFNVDDPTEIRSRIEMLQTLKDDSSSTGSIDRFNESELDGAINFLNKRLEQLEGSTKADPEAQKKANGDVKKRQLEIEKERHKLGMQRAFGEAVKKISDQLVKGAKKAYRNRVKRARKNDPALKETGIQGTFLRKLDDTITDWKEGRLVAKQIGGSVATDYTRLNGGKAVRKFNPEKGGKKDTVYYIENEDGSIDHIVVNAKPVHPNGGLDETVPPTRFIEIDGELKLNPFYRHISPNELTSKTGVLQKVEIVEGIDPRSDLDGAVVKVSDSGDMIANVQKSLDGTTTGRKESAVGKEKTDLISGGYDAIKFTHKGEVHYKLVTRDQLMESGQLKNRDLLDTSKYEHDNVTRSFEAEGANGRPLDADESEVPTRYRDSETFDLEEPSTLQEAWNNKGKVIEEGDFGIGVVRFGDELYRTQRDTDSVSISKIAHDADGEYDEIILMRDTMDEVLEEMNFIERGSRNVEAEKVISGLRELGVEDEKVFRELRNAEFETEVDGNARELDPDRTKVEFEDAEVGDWVSVPHNGKLVNAKVVRKDKEMLSYRPINEHGVLGKKVDKYVDSLNRTDQIFTPFAMKTAGITIASLAGGAVLDLDLEGFETEQAGFGEIMAIALLAGLARKGYRAYKSNGSTITQKFMKGFRKSRNNEIDPELKATLEFWDTQKEVRRLENMGITVKPNDVREQQFAREVETVLKSEGTVDEIAQSIMRSKYTESTLSMVDRHGSHTGKKLGEILMDMPRTIERFRRKFETEYNEKHGANAFKNLMRNGHEKISDLVPDEQQGTLSRIARGDINTRNSKEQFDLAFTRLMNSKIERDENGVYKVVDSTNTVRQDLEGDNGALYREIDQRFLDDEEMMDAIFSVKNRMKAVKNEWKDMLTGLERQLIQTVNLPEYYRTIKNGDGEYTFSSAQYGNVVDNFFLKFDGNWKEYIQLHTDPAVKKLLKNAWKHDPQIQRLNEVRSAGLQFTEGLSDMYFPQMLSRSKIGKVRDGMTDEAFDKQLFDEMTKLNPDNDALRKFDPDTGQMRQVQFETEEKLIAKVKQLLESKNTPDKVRKGFEQMFGPITSEQEGSYFSLVERLKRSGVLQKKIVEADLGDGKTRTVERFVLEGDEDGGFPIQYRGPEGEIETFDLISIGNQKGFEKMYEKMLTGDYVKNSNFLERPREVNIPTKYLETDPEQVLERYARDVGFRMKMVQEGAFDETAMNQNYWSQIKKQLQDAGIRNPSKYVDRLKTAYHTIGNIVPELGGKTAQERKEFLETRLRNKQFSEAFRNFLYGKYAQTIALYDTIQPLVSTSNYTSFKSTARAYKTVFNNKKLNNLINISQDYGVVKRQLDAMLADFDDSAKFNVHSDDALANFAGKANSLTRKYQRFFTQRFDYTDMLPNHLSSTRMLKENAGVRLAMGNLQNKNEVNLTLNWVAHLYEANDLAQKLKKVNSGEGVRGMSKEDVLHKFELMGVARDDVQYFADNIDQMNDGLRRIEDEGGRMESNEMDAKMSELIEGVVNRATETYHGKNVMFRPDGWHSDGMRMITTFSNFSFNQALQVTQRRTFKPIGRFLDNHPDVGGKMDVARLMMMSKFKSPKKRRAYLKKQGLSNKAIDEIPLESMSTMGRAMLSSGISDAFYFSLDAMYALLSMSILEGIGIHNTTTQDDLVGMGFIGPEREFDPNNVIINPRAPFDEQIRLGDWAEASQLQDFSNSYAFAMASMTRFRDGMLQNGLGGPMAPSILQYGDPTPSGMSMGLRLVTDAIKTAKTVTDGDYTTAENTPSLLYNTGRAVLPPMQVLEPADYRR